MLSENGKHDTEPCRISTRPIFIHCLFVLRDTLTPRVRRPVLCVIDNLAT
jgi:hypothetical protein